MRFKKTSLVGAILAAALVISACASGNDGGGDAVFGGDLEAVELTLMGFSDPDEIGQTRWDIAAEAIAPATIRPSDGGFDIQAFLAARSAGNVPDLIYFSRGDFAGTLASLGAIMPLDACIAAEGINTDDFNPAALAQVRFDGRTYGVPEFNQVQLTMANADLLQANGLTISDVDASDWDAMIEANLALAVPGAVVGIDPRMPPFFPLWVISNGGQLVSDDGRTAMIDSPEAIEALTQAMRLLDDQGGFAGVQSLNDAMDFWGDGNQFAVNTLGSFFMEQWYLNVLMNASPDIPLAVSPFVSRVTGNPIAFSTGSTWAIPVGAANPAAACRFIANMVEVDSWMAAAQVRHTRITGEGGNMMPLLTANTTADQAIRDAFVTPTGNPIWDAAIDATYTAAANHVFMPPLPADQEFRQAWIDAVNRVLQGNMTIEDSLALGQTEAQRALDEGWARMAERD